MTHPEIKIKRWKKAACRYNLTLTRTSDTGRLSCISKRTTAEQQEYSKVLECQVYEQLKVLLIKLNKQIDQRLAFF